MTNLRVAVYRGTPVLTWWEGATKQGLGEGAFVVADQTYREIARFDAAAGRPSDLHELILTPRGTAFVSSYETLPMDLTSIGGPKQGQVVGGVVQELELPHGRKLFEWKSLDHVQVSEAHQAVAKGPFDYFHLNSIEPTPDGNLLVSGRNTWAVYKVDHGSGAVRWRLGGKRSSFAMGSGTRFAWQHDARWHTPGEVSLFDNGAAPKVHSQSRGLRIGLDTKRMRASLVRAYMHSSERARDRARLRSAICERQLARELGDGAVLHRVRPARRRPPRRRAARGAVDVPHAALPVGRAPGRRSAAVVRATADSSYLHVSWNGATEVATWALHAGKSASSPRACRHRPETRVRDGLAASAVRPLRRCGRARPEGREARAVGDRPGYVGVAPA